MFMQLILMLEVGQKSMTPCFDSGGRGRRLKMTFTRIFQIWNYCLVFCDWLRHVRNPFTHLFLLFICFGPFYITTGPLAQWVRGKSPPWPQGQGYESVECTLTIFPIFILFFLFYLFHLIFLFCFIFQPLYFYYFDKILNINSPYFCL